MFAVAMKKINRKGRGSNEPHFVTTNAIQLRTASGRRPKATDANCLQTIRSYSSSNPNELTYECYDYVELITSAPKFGIWYRARNLRTQALGLIAAEAIERVIGVPEGDRSSVDRYVSTSKCKLYTIRLS